MARCSPLSSSYSVTHPLTGPLCWSSTLVVSFEGSLLVISGLWLVTALLLIMADLMDWRDLNGVFLILIGRESCTTLCSQSWSKTRERIWTRIFFFFFLSKPCLLKLWYCLSTLQPWGSHILQSTNCRPFKSNSKNKILC